MNDNDVHGVECQSCHRETFQTFEREIMVLAKVCPACARRIDDKAVEEAQKAALDGMTKEERREARKEQSREWARSWHGQSVRVKWVEVESFQNQVREKSIRGQAWFACPTDRSYGRVRVVIDDSEYPRLIEHENEYRRRKYRRIDGNSHGPSLVAHGHDEVQDIPYAFFINWGEREEYVLEPWDNTKEIAERRAEEERIAALHRGEGI